MNTYLLPRDISESARLDMQHRGLVACTRSFAHPSLGDLSQFRTILDNGTGTTVWASNALSGGTGDVVVKIHEDAVVEGADISDKQFPKAGRHPRLGELYVHDILQPFPASKQNR